MKQLDELLKKKFKDFSGYVLMAEKSKMDRPQLVKDYEAALNGLVDETKQAIQALIEEEKTKAYKLGYIDGGVEEILRHEKARKKVIQELSLPTKLNYGELKGE